ncbi:MAG: Pantoate--beta-alanine ligase [Frankiales bacterium]|nr:Pantoate--beta-alanine ligase [Frankiales bacterium]
MGALHDGHASLIRLARQRADHVLVSIFVNPLQFGAGEDFERYPRPLESDLAIAHAAGADLVFAPDRREVWPTPPKVTVDAGPVQHLYEGAIRPGHFNGVCTVVLALFNLLRPDISVFGQKDAQQLAVIKAMVRDLAVPVQIVGAPIVREADGLAMSSRNRYLSAAERADATVLSRALAAGAARGADGGGAVLDAAREVLASVPAVRVDYLDLVTPDFAPADEGGALLVVAAGVGGTRLLDNVPVALMAGS